MAKVSEDFGKVYLYALEDMQKRCARPCSNSVQPFICSPDSLFRTIKVALLQLNSNESTTEIGTDAALNEPWPLKGFADAACKIIGTSLHKLHQYHEFQREGPLNEQVWARDFTSQGGNTRSKQVIERLRKYSQMKWETFYPTLQPLTYYLPKAIHDKAFATHAFAAMAKWNRQAIRRRAQQRTSWR